MERNDFEINMDDLPTPQTKTEEETNGEAPTKKKKKRKKSKSAAAAANEASSEAARPAAPPKQGIKMGPLIMLIMMTGTTLLPALLYAGDWFGNFRDGRSSECKPQPPV